MLKLSEVLLAPGLGLTRARPPAAGAAEPSPADPSVQWAHVSELADPTPWLMGGELLLTTGLELFAEREPTRAYCERLAAAGVAGLGLSTGDLLPHPELPGFLVEEAARAGLPLVHVPESTPLQAVVRRVSDALNEAQNLPLRRALVAQRQLSEAATSPDGVSAVLGVLATTTGFSAAVADPGLRVIARSGTEGEEQFRRRRAEIGQRVPDGLRWSIATDEDGDSSIVSPLGTQGRLRGVMVAVKRGPASSYDRALLSMVFSLLSVLLELRHSGSHRERAARAEAVDALIGGELSPIEAAVQLARAGVEAQTLRCAVVSAELAEPLLLALGSGLDGRCSDLLVRRRGEHTVLLLCDPDAEAPARLAEILTRHGAPATGLGGVVSPENAPLSLRQAERARALAHARGVAMVTLPDGGGYRALLSLGDPAERASFADEVLLPLDEYDAHNGTDLRGALRAYLEAASSIDAAATALGVHRHTMRARLAKITELSGRDLGNANDLLEVWLATEFRGLALVEDPGLGARSAR